MDMDFPERMPEVFPHNPDAKHWFSGAMLETTVFRNSSLQGAYFIVAARAIGLDVGPMSGFDNARSEEHTSELQSLMRISYAVFCLNKKKLTTYTNAPKKQ